MKYLSKYLNIYLISVIIKNFICLQKMNGYQLLQRNQKQKNSLYQLLNQLNRFL